MKAVLQTRQFKRDIKRLQRRGKEVAKLKGVVQWLVEGQALDRRLRDHALAGEWPGSRDCHLEPDWVLIYRTTADLVVLVRTGTHSDLFK
ncbi:MAG: type II toxin-antitoxin system YafQ family toxin [Verrucomicrobia bacterium]|nr:type II toxin-antitoxin system YafQ family toxin [Verrucomicrobiota bacterium]